MNENTGTLTINLAAIVANWRTVAAYADSSVTSAVVKADAYGMGVEQVAPALYRAGCRHFFFATLSEAVAGRSLVGADAQCYLLGCVPGGSEADVVRHRLVPVLSSLVAVNRWLAWRAGAGFDASSAPAAVKFDTGMTRSGLAVAELQHLLGDAERWAELSPVLLMSHLAVADEASNPQNRRQRDAFFALGTLAKRLQPDLLLSLANSCGTYLGRDYHADLVRPGAALYGFNPVVGGESPMLPVVRLSLPVMSLRALTQPSQVGYGAEYTALPGQVLAVVAGGYADGLHRILGREGYGYCLGVKVPVVGRISMDSTVFDVTAVTDLHEIDGRQTLNIDVLGEGDLSVDALTRRNQALGYEVLTCVRSGRYRRIYQGE
ncbi:alanine racemase [Gilvimarinus agarilyticus]|uniref:alanine racemase n=1 Tax=Gilvimarinus agarilyticus TaxID=679259 RepID=UPI00059F8A1F|nr:alanine racemase [Gilvimarinus agarilyticus]